jgi:hypothetical protein
MLQDASVHRSSSQGLRMGSVAIDAKSCLPQEGTRWMTDAGGTNSTDGCTQSAELRISQFDLTMRLERSLPRINQHQHAVQLQASRRPSLAAAARLLRARLCNADAHPLDSEDCGGVWQLCMCTCTPWAGEILTLESPMHGHHAWTHSQAKLSFAIDNHLSMRIRRAPKTCHVCNMDASTSHAL